MYIPFATSKSTASVQYTCSVTVIKRALKIPFTHVCTYLLHTWDHREKALEEVADEVYFADENRRYCHTTQMNISHHNTVGKTCNYCLVCMCILILYMACI